MAQFDEVQTMNTVLNLTGPAQVQAVLNAAAGSGPDVQVTQTAYKPPVEFAVNQVATAETPLVQNAALVNDSTANWLAVAALLGIAYGITRFSKRK